MKKVNVLLAAVAMGWMALGAVAQTSSNTKDDLFAGTEVFAKNATDVTEITMDPDTLSMVNGKDKDKAHDTVLQVVRTYEYDKPGMYNMADVDRFRDKLNTGDWHCSVHQRNMKTGESTDVCMKRRNDDLHESAIITVEPKELTFIHTISHHASMMGMPGMPGVGAIGMGYSYGLGTSMAMLSPEMLQLRIQLNSLKTGLAIAPFGAGMMAFPKIDDDAWEKSQKDWEKSGMKMKQFIIRDGEHRFVVAPDAPEPAEPPQPALAPAAPEALPAPAAPQTTPSPATPEATPAPETAPTPKAEVAPALLVVPAAQAM